MSHYERLLFRDESSDTTMLPEVNLRGGKSVSGAARVGDLHHYRRRQHKKCVSVHHANRLILEVACSQIERRLVHKEGSMDCPTIC